MIIWQVNWSPADINHKLFVVSANRFSLGRSKKQTVINFERAKTYQDAYFFYLELIK